MEMPPPEVPKMKKKMTRRREEEDSSTCGSIIRGPDLEVIQAHKKVREWLDTQEPTQTTQQKLEQLKQFLIASKHTTPFDNYDVGHKCNIEFHSETPRIPIGWQKRSAWMTERLTRFPLVKKEIDEEKFNTCLKICIECAVAKTFCLPICPKLLIDQTDLVEKIEGSQKLNSDEKYMCALVLAEFALVRAYSEAKTLP